MPYYYFDYAATTPVDQRVIDKMIPCMGREGVFANPSSRHAAGKEAHALVELAREQVADCINAEPQEIIWTSGATESDNLAIKGAAALYQKKGKHIITSKTEHKAVLDACQHLEKEGYQLTYLVPDRNGLIHPDNLLEHIRPDTILVSLMHVNNEIGAVNDIQALAEVTSSRGILLHVDAAQSIGRLDVDVKKWPVDLVSLSAHKAYGPKGMGALYLRKKPRVRVQPLMHGGGHEQGMRSGTLPTPQIMGMGEAFAIAKKERAADYKRIELFRRDILQGLADIKKIQPNVDIRYCVPHILNLRFEGMLADALMAKMPDVAATTSSACQAKGVEGSHVLRAIGLSEEFIKGSMRFSMGRFTKQEDVDGLIRLIRDLFKR